MGFDFPNLPYLIDVGAAPSIKIYEPNQQETPVEVRPHVLKLTETYAIHKYLAARYKADLLGFNP